MRSTAKASDPIVPTLVPTVHVGRQTLRGGAQIRGAGGISLAAVRAHDLEGAVGGFAVHGRGIDDTARSPP